MRTIRPTASKRPAFKATAKRNTASFSPAVHRAAMLFSLAMTLAVGSLVLIAVAPQPLRGPSPAALSASTRDPVDGRSTEDQTASGDDAKLSSASLSAER